jgi:transcriptional regulator with XRE-family HTH domain
MPSTETKPIGTLTGRLVAERPEPEPISLLGQAWSSDPGLPRETGRRTFCDRLSAMRHHQGLSLAELGSLVGVTAACVCKWEKGDTFPTHASLIRLARSLGTTFEYLLLGHTEISIGSGGNGAPDIAVTEAVLDARTRVARAMNISLNRVHISVDDD